MNQCLYCNTLVKNKYCNVGCQNKHQNSKKSNNKYGNFINFEKSCQRCNNVFFVKERENLHPQKLVYFCSRSCANIRNHSVEIKNKIRMSLKKLPKKPKIIKQKIKVELTCKECNKFFIVDVDKKQRIVCSKTCASKIAGKKSVISQSRRSKNEIYFAELCSTHFDNVLTNEPMFNGWDADIIIPNKKIAVLWNGIWHYKKITKKHSVEQVQNRDKIKINEIKKLGYTPYIIQDLGKYDKSFVENEFQKFIKMGADHDLNVNYTL